MLFHHCEELDQNFDLMLQLCCLYNKSKVDSNILAAPVLIDLLKIWSKKHQLLTTHWLNDNFKSRDACASRKRLKQKTALTCGFPRGSWARKRFPWAEQRAASCQRPRPSSPPVWGDHWDLGLDFEDNHNKVENILRIIAMALKTLRIIAMIFQTMIIVVDNLISSTNLTVLLLLAPRRWFVIVML